MNVDEIVDQVTEEIYRLEPALLERFGEQGKAKCREDNHHHMRHLRTAYELDETKVFSDYAVWLDGILTRHGMKTEHLVDNFGMIKSLLAEDNSEPAKSYCQYLMRAIEILKGKSETEEVGN
ncbi:globin family protein [Bhargavaea beijingensis]|uniref:Uncharacterized protein n=1 Tax=Bhargavaea beijingensis TaxID=426756 RepID=A0A1G7E6E8_9BACL|nr:hypothetical protein [Bhargavaea beijingensis]MCW1927526.1 hypothetical protein [Bhargavaea beijingensis]RSK34919.1 hypothetical protein EJA12_04385 [Bhargavaea beijingensis]SDE59252.1 hypothetical protein SAMN04488126_11285 [Bhargavaea beijingensis]